MRRLGSAVEARVLALYFLVFEEYSPGHHFGYGSPNFHGSYRQFDRDTRHNTHSVYKALGWGGQVTWVVPDSDPVVVFTGSNCTENPPCDELMARYILPALEG